MPNYLVECYAGVPPQNVNQVKEFVRANGGNILDDFESFNGFSVEIPKDFVTHLKSHEHVEDVEFDVLATDILSSKEEEAAPPEPDDVLSLERKRLIRHLGLENTSAGQPSRAANPVPSLFFIESAPCSTRGAKALMLCDPRATGY
ncbi:uncharacterized protein N7458_006113 [Penicillium daleae]|uniref:Inhibitor I9 domain-containing protein n=1 Tax=Penicillium daleae TaxID=63821 RepID=A0AAD6G1Q6_9EURO|nr:uncharacterized protein N7458_006113 [Penicillium daleae]KAJ5449664.1 hypothetical protein N7458_006113 [Penicillium daleae]